MDGLQLSPLKATGCYYTFYNRQQAKNRVHSKIEWDFGNLSWISTHGHVEAEFMLPGMFGHSPILLQVCPPSHLNPRPFKLFKTMLNLLEFKKVLNIVWQR